jgi:hypothetical protein
MGSHAVDVAYLKPVWQEFTQTMDAFHAMLDEQREVIHTLRSTTRICLA